MFAICRYPVITLRNVKSGGKKLSHDPDPFKKQIDLDETFFFFFYQNPVELHINCKRLQNRTQIAFLQAEKSRKPTDKKSLLVRGKRIVLGSESRRAH